MLLQCEVYKNEEKEPFLKFQKKAISRIWRFKYPLRRCTPSVALASIDSVIGA